MQASLNALTVGPVDSPLEELHIFCSKSKMIRFIGHVESIPQALKKLNYSTQIHLVICDLRYSIKDLQYFFRAAPETLYGGYCCYFGLLHYSDDEVSDDLKVKLPFHGFLSSPFSKESRHDLEILVNNARKILQDKPVIQWLEGVAEKLLVQVDILVELKKAGYSRETYEFELLTISDRLRGLHPRFLSKWEQILLDFFEENKRPKEIIEDQSYNTVSNYSDASKHSDASNYKGASDRVAKMVNEKNASVTEESFESQNSNFIIDEYSEILPDFEEFPMPMHPTIKPSNKPTGGRPMLRNIMNKTRSDT